MWTCKAMCRVVLRKTKNGIYGQLQTVFGTSICFSLRKETETAVQQLKIKLERKENYRDI